MIINRWVKKTKSLNFIYTKVYVENRDDELFLLKLEKT
jgi:hypothetical protein